MVSSHTMLDVYISCVPPFYGSVKFMLLLVTQYIVLVGKRIILKESMSNNATGLKRQCSQYMLIVVIRSLFEL